MYDNVLTKLQKVYKVTRKYMTLEEVRHGEEECSQCEVGVKTKPRGNKLLKETGNCICCYCFH